MIFFFLSLIFILLGVAFYTLFERKLLSLSQKRMGPNKVFMKAIIQPVLDGFKLFLKELKLLKKSSHLIFVLGPNLIFLFMLMLFFSLNAIFVFLSLKMLILLLMSIFGLTVYSTMLSGWSSFSKYSLTGSIRSCSQSISYEVLMNFLLIFFFFFFSTMSMNNFFFISMFIFIPMLFLLFLSLVTESNRAPFDFSEGESELISGFNIEYGSGGFVLLFLGEYGMMIFSCLLLSILSTKMFFMFIFIFFFFLFLFILIRSSYPRFRYDFLMNSLWLKFLPIFCFYFFIFLS